MWPHAIAIHTQFNMQAQFNGRLSNVFETSRKKLSPKPAAQVPETVQGSDFRLG